MMWPWQYCRTSTAPTPVGRQPFEEYGGSQFGELSRSADSG